MANGSKGRKNYGQYLNKAWNIGARHALYRENGTWYHKLTSFPGALIDANGYILFPTEQDYLECEHLQIGRMKNWIVTRNGLAEIPGYKRIISALPDVDLISMTAREGDRKLVEQHLRRERNQKI